MARAPTTFDPFNAIAESGRRELLTAIGSSEVSVNDLVHQLGMTQPQVSKHLGVLRAVDLVLVRTDGRHRYYRVNASALKPIHDWVRQFERQWNARLDRMEDLINELKDQENSQ